MYTSRLANKKKLIQMHIVGAIYFPLLFSHAFGHWLHLPLSSRRVKNATSQETCFSEENLHRYKYDTCGTCRILKGSGQVVDGDKDIVYTHKDLTNESWVRGKSFSCSAHKLERREKKKWENKNVVLAVVSYISVV